ncbi:MAG: hypothetical protein V4628_13020 [Pseudomonadota bacterium]
MKRFLMTGCAIVVLLVSNVSLAGHNDNRGNGHGRGHNKFESRHNDSRNYDRRDTRVIVRDNYRYYDRDDGDNVSINLSFGAVRPFGYNAYGYNMQGYNPDPFGNRARQPTIVYQNNTYIEPAQPAYSTSYTTRRTNRQGVSLLRESSGRCFERTRDAYGNETRIELPRSDCNF